MIHEFAVDAVQNRLEVVSFPWILAEASNIASMEDDIFDNTSHDGKSLRDGLVCERNARTYGHDLRGTDCSKYSTDEVNEKYQVTLE